MGSGPLPRKVMLAIVAASAISSAGATHGNKREVRSGATSACAAIFSGRVLTPQGKPVHGAQVEVRGTKTNTDEGGGFRLDAAGGCCESCSGKQLYRSPSSSAASRYLLNISKPDSGIVSKIYRGGVKDVTLRMTPGTSQTFDPTQPITLRNIRGAGDCTGTLSSQVNWSQYPDLRTPRSYDRSGTVRNTSAPAEVLGALTYAESARGCSPGATIMIPARTLVDSGGAEVTSPVTVMIATVDPNDLDSMPGDYSATLNGRAATMLTWGAATVNVSGLGGRYQLRKGAEATLMIPIDPRQLKQAKPPSRVPFLVFDETRGIWAVEGTARLDLKQNAYVASVRHFSTYNMDILKTDQACLRIDTSGISGPFLLEASVPTSAGTVVRSRAVDNSETLNALYNLPPGVPFGLRAFRALPTGGVEPITDTVSVDPLGTQSPTDPNDPVAPYDACRWADGMTAHLALTEASRAPVVSGPFASSTGTFTLTWRYQWGSGLSSTADGYQLEESTTSATTGFAVVFSSTGLTTADTTSPKTYVLTRPAGTYHYRVRAFQLGQPSPYSNVHYVVVSSGGGGPSPTSLRIVNDLADQMAGPNDWARLNTIIRVRIASTANEVLVNGAYERLTPTDGPLASPGDAIPPAAGTDTSYWDFDVSNLGSVPEYWVYIQTGWWDPLVDPVTFDSIGWMKHVSVVVGCDGSSSTYKWATVRVFPPYGNPEVIRASTLLPPGNWYGSSFCF